MSSERLLPFGVRFEEPAREAGDIPAPIYDEASCVSLLTLPSGRTVPFVEADLLGTETFTQVRAESSDTDPEDDHARFQGMGTSTVTNVRRESTDTDPEEDHRVDCHGLGTETFTCVESEGTDTDPEEDR